METSKGPYTGIRLDDVSIPAGVCSMDALGYAWQAALELNATAYGFDVNAWQRAGWQDILSLRLTGEKRERRIHSVPRIGPITRPHLETLVSTAFESGQPEPAEVEKALVMTHPLAGGRHLVAVTFRGTGNTARDWEPNFACHPTKEVHTGFLRLAAGFAAAAPFIVLSQLGAAVEEPELTLAMVGEELTRPDCRFQLLLTGYSQGGAVMQLYAKRLFEFGARPEHLLGLGFASPSVSYAALPDDDLPLYHLANADDLTPRVGAYRHLGQLWQYAPDDRKRARWYGPAYDDPQLKEFCSMTASWRNMEQALGFSVQLMRAVIGLPRYDVCAFLAGLLNSLIETSITRAAERKADVTARVLLFKLGSEYRAVFGELPPESGMELLILRRMLAVGPEMYARRLWRAMALPHALVRSPMETPAGYHDIVLHHMHELTRVNETIIPR